MPIYNTILYYFWNLWHQFSWTIWPGMSSVLKSSKLVTLCIYCFIAVIEVLLVEGLLLFSSCKDRNKWKLSSIARYRDLDTLSSLLWKLGSQSVCRLHPRQLQCRHRGSIVGLLCLDCPMHRFVSCSEQWWICPQGIRFQEDIMI